MIYIYFLHRGDGIPFYVGKTNNLKNRCNLHSFNRKNKTYIEEIDLVVEKEWKFWEEHYISLYKSWGFKLENKTLKGRGPENNRVVTWGDKIGLSNKNKSKNWSEEEVIQRKLRIRGNKFLLGYKYTKQQKLNCSIGKRVNINQYDLNGNLIKEWSATFTEIANFFKKDSSSLTHHLKGRQKTAFGYIWKYK